jgi:hypothetical protein
LLNVKRIIFAVNFMDGNLKFYLFLKYFLFVTGV